MYELKIAKSFLVPRKKQFSATIIASLSVLVISLVVWLVLVFLSVTDGIEKNWLHKLTSLNAPVRVVPTSKYYRSYYYLIDKYSMDSDYQTKSVREKLEASNTDPYNQNFDQELPKNFPKKLLNSDGHAKDPVKTLFASINTLSERYGSLNAQDYEITGCLLKLKLLREHAVADGFSVGDTQSYISQMMYLSSFQDKNPHLNTLLIPPSESDINHLLYLAKFSLSQDVSDKETRIEHTNASAYRRQIQQILQNVNIFSLTPKNSQLQLFTRDFEDNIKLSCAGYINNGEITHLLVPILAKQQVSSPLLKWGTLSKKNGKTVFSYEKGNLLPADDLPIYLENPTFKISDELDLIVSSNTQSSFDLPINLTTSIQGHSINIKRSLNQFNVTTAVAKTQLKEMPSPLPLWPTYLQNEKRYSLDPQKGKDTPIILPKSFKDLGVFVGDTGYISYGVATTSNLQEQRLPIFVSGFYDPGVMAVGAKCILAPYQFVSDIASSATNYTLDDLLSSGVQIWTDDLKQVSSLKTDLETLLKSEGISDYFEVITYNEYPFAKDLLLQFKSDKNLFSLIGVIILLVACSSIISFLVLMVNDKKKDVGVLMSLGASKTSIIFIFACCGAALGLIGCALGTLCAFLTLHNISAVVSFLSMVQGHTAFHETFYGSSLPSTLSSSATSFILTTTPVLSIIAGLIPAWKASRVNPAAILRSE